MQFSIVFLEHFFLPSLPRSCQALMVLELFGIIQSNSSFTGERKKPEEVGLSCVPHTRLHLVRQEKMLVSMEQGRILNVQNGL